MHPSRLNHLLLTALAARGILASPTQLKERGLEVIDITPPSVNPNDAKRDLEVIDITPPAVDPTEEKRDLQARSYNIDHCGVNGGTWMPLVAVNSQESGFDDAVTAFCSHFDGTVIPGASSVAALVQSTGGEVLRLTDGTIGHFEGVIYCRKGKTCNVTAALCQEYMDAIGASGSKCYGKKNQDTKGGRNDLSDSYYDAIPLKGAD